MATHIQSSYERSLWIGIAVGFLIDTAVIFIVLLVFFPATPAPLLWAFGLRIALEILASLYGLYVFAKRLIWFQFFEKRNRIEQTQREFMQVGFPEPEPYYNDADEYLGKVARDEEVGAEARFNAAFLLGVLLASGSSDQSARASSPRWSLKRR